ncbi:MAG: trypsin-like peptidase domain-containing protein [Elusimicrobiota bacterium]
MKNKITLLIPILLFSANLYAENPARSIAGYMPVAIYGNDDRAEFYQTDEISKKLASSTAALFRSKDLSDLGNGFHQIRPVTLKEKFNLNENEAFSDQPAVSFCSAALVGKDLILTSAHCLSQVPCEKIKIAFDYRIESAGRYPEFLKSQDIYSCKSVVSQKYDPNGADYAIIKTDRQVNRTPLPVNRKDDIKKNTKVFVIGYPSGLPVKIANNAKVREVKTEFFITDLDTFKGNSGSPVFNNETMKIEGVLSRGGTDYMYNSYVSETPEADPRNPNSPIYRPGTAHKVGQDEGRGEDVTKSFVFQALIPQSDFEKALNEAIKQGVRFEREKQNGIRPAVYTPSDWGQTQIQPAVYYPPVNTKPEVIEI